MYSNDEISQYRNVNGELLYQRHCENMGRISNWAALTSRQRARYHALAMGGEPDEATVDKWLDQAEGNGVGLPYVSWPIDTPEIPVKIGPKSIEFGPTTKEGVYNGWLNVDGVAYPFTLDFPTTTGRYFLQIDGIIKGKHTGETR